MKFFSWMHKKLINGGQAQTKSIQQEKQEQYYCHEQRQLLSIGTLGNHAITEKPNIQKQSLMMSEEENDEDMSDFSPEEVGKLEKELKKLLRKKELSVSASTELPLDRFLNCPSSLEMDRRISDISSCSSSSVQQDEEEEVIIDRTIRVIIDRCKTICKERKKGKLGIGKKSISFLFNKMFFLCGNGFNSSPATSMIDSRMEKLLRTMLSMKFNHSQNKKQLVEGKSLRSRKELESDEIDEKKNGHQWVKTDSEYIVLEI
ncbi:protein NEGATIVE GRAVITROPIC RESPONSE OF ROOTS-like [Impatiens glandulifera]|uniref:protein NEGATIVE GRAVITROPIC RESPONSE OF ROOTS-like n=1 Tax=Impatiens glandulifera TaxID=253017 RepID=UPI001FB0A26C|nr:protein NEGATIVE GRAVITROPIC RESPONSE OF ROOTS-like [Impatiens glandulifera]